MIEETLNMSRKERKRLVVMEQVQAGGLTLVEGAERMGLSYRQAKRVWKRFREQGHSGLIHASRGRIGNRRLDQALKQQALALFDENYSDYGPTLASEVLEEEHNVKVHPETLRRWLHGAHLITSRTRPRRNRLRRPRRRCFGELVQIDGSHHAWLEERGETCCLMVAVDDATGRTLCRMSPQETGRAAFELLRQWIERHGVPAAVYVDRKNIYQTDREPSAEEKRAGTGALTDFGRACWQLDIEVICAHSPEAKGRVERKNGVLQDRLVKKLRRCQSSTIDEANAMLEDFTRDLDKKQARAPASPVDRHRRSPGRRLLREILCWEQQRSVQRDATISYEGDVYQILEGTRGPRPKQRVTVRRRLDGTLAILHDGRFLRYRTAAS